MVNREIIYGRVISLWRAWSRTKKTGSGRKARDPVTARFHSLFGAVNIAIFEYLPFATFVLAPYVASYVAGPSAILSVFIGSLAAILSGIAFVDIRCRFWKEATTVHDVIYHCGSEITAFAVSWCSIAHTSAMTAASVRASSQSLNYLLQQRLTILSLSLFDWVPSFDASGVDVLGFLLCMVVWTVVALKLTSPLGRVFVLLLNSVGLAILGVVIAASAMHFRLQNWKGLELFFPDGYTGVVSGAGLFYLAFGVFENLSKFVEYVSPKSHRLHLKSSLFGVVVLSLLLVSFSSVVTLIASASNLTTEQPLSEAFEVAGVHPWAKHFVCVASMVLLVPVVYIQFERCVQVVENLAEDGLLGHLFASDEDCQERSVITCMGVGFLAAFASAWFSVVTLCRIAAIGILAKHLLVLLVVLTDRYRPIDSNRNSPGIHQIQVKALTESSASDTTLFPDSFQRIFVGSWLTDDANRTDTQNVKEFSDDLRRIRQVLKPNETEMVIQSPLAGDRSLHPHKKSKVTAATTSSDKDQHNEISNTKENSEILHSKDSRQPRTTLSSERDSDSEGEWSSDTDIDAIVEDYIRSKNHNQTDLSSNTPAKAALTYNNTTYRKAILSALLFVVSSLTLAAILAHAQSHFRNGEVVYMTTASLIALLFFLSLVFLGRQPKAGGEEESEDSRFRFGNLFFIYEAAIFMNCTLLGAQSSVTMIVFGIWTALGLTIYVFYGMHHSRHAPANGHLPDEQRSLLMTSSPLTYTKDRPQDQKSFKFCDGILGESSVP